MFFRLTDYSLFTRLPPIKDVHTEIESFLSRQKPMICPSVLRFPRSGSHSAQIWYHRNILLLVRYVKRRGIFCTEEKNIFRF